VVEWWDQTIRATRIWGLANTEFSFLDRTLLDAFVDRWLRETNNFYISSGEITVTLNDVYCILHLPYIGEWRVTRGLTCLE
jgi:hypothetical protein